MNNTNDTQSNWVDPEPDDTDLNEIANSLLYEETKAYE